MAAASSITTSSACPSFTESAGWMYCKQREDTVTAGSSLPGIRETSEFTKLEPWKAPSLLSSNTKPETETWKSKRQERVYAALTRTGSLILFSTIPHQFICRGEENKGNLITTSSSCIAPFTFLCFCFGRNPRGSSVIYKSFPGSGKVFWGSHCLKVCLSAKPTRTVTHHTEWTCLKPKQLQHWQKQQPGIKSGKARMPITWMVCLCSLNTFTLTTALLNSGFKDWTIS